MSKDWRHAVSRRELDALREKAEQATAGEWHPYCDYQWDLGWLCNDKDYAYIATRVGRIPGRYIALFEVDRSVEEAQSFTIDPADKKQVAADITFVAAANPQTVLALLNYIDELEERSGEKDEP
jgi:hypothetical protein